MMPRRIKVNTYDGVSEFTFDVNAWSGKAFIKVYNILQPNGWRQKRQSFTLFYIGEEMAAKVNTYRANQLHIDIHDNNAYTYSLIVDGIDYIDA
jgi:hypothetical protein